MIKRCMVLFGLLLISRNVLAQNSKAEDLLLGIDDLPSGWIAKAPAISEPRETGNYNFLCDNHPRRSTEGYSIDFKKSEFGPFFSQHVSFYSGEDSQLSFSEILASAKRCSEWIVTDEKGIEHKMKSAAMSFSKFGDQSFAVRTTMEAPILGSLETDSVYVRMGNMSFSIQHYALGPKAIDSKDTELLVRLAYEKLLKATTK